MAISVDTVYKTVLLILNNEQRGYMTPDEFNKIGTQVQRKIFERYFEDLNQQVRIPQSDMEYSDRVAITDEKIAEFKTEQGLTISLQNGFDNAGIFNLPEELYRLGSVTYYGSNPKAGPSGLVEVQRVGRADYYNIIKSPLTAPTTSHPIYLYEDNKITLYPKSINSNVRVQYVKKPADIRWGYVLGNLNQYVFTNYSYDATAINLGDITSSITTNISGGTPQTYTNLTSLTGSGTGAFFTITVDSTGVVSSINVDTQGSGYVVGDVLQFSAGLFGSTGPDLEITLTAANLFSGSQQGFTDFGLHTSEQTEVILNILLYSGIVIRDPSIIQVAAQKIQQEEVNEKS